MDETLIDTMIQDCTQRQERLSEWEINFIDSIEGQRANNRQLSGKQEETLNKIWEKATDEG